MKNLYLDLKILVKSSWFRNPFENRWKLSDDCNDDYIFILFVNFDYIVTRFCHFIKLLASYFSSVLSVVFARFLIITFLKFFCFKTILISSNFHNYFQLFQMLFLKFLKKCFSVSNYIIHKWYQFLTNVKKISSIIHTKRCALSRKWSVHSTKIFVKKFHSVPHFLHLKFVHFVHLVRFKFHCNNFQ